MFKIPYDSDKGLFVAEAIQKFATLTAYDESCNLAKEKGSFKNFDANKYLEANFIKEKLTDEIRKKIKETGIRNSSLMTCPPVGTGSMLAGNISSGIEPIFALQYERKMRDGDGFKAELMEDYAWKIYREKGFLELFLNEQDTKDYLEKYPKFFKTAMEIDPKKHIDMQATLQYWIDGSISKTINLPSSTTKDYYEEILFYAIDKGLKGITTFTEGTREGVLSVKKEEKKYVVDINSNNVDGLVANISSDVPIKPKRPRILSGRTYQIPEANGQNTYCTINSNNGKPWEIFFNANNDHAEWFSALGRLASRVMRKTGDVQAVIDELAQIKGNGFFVEGFGYCESKPALISKMLQEFTESLDVKAESETKKEYKITGEICSECKGKIIKHGGCSQCENGCANAFKCG